MFAALEKICSQGANGLALQSLWPNLHVALSSAELNLSSGVKAAIWANLLKTLGLGFQSRNVFRDADDPAIQPIKQCKKLNLKIVATEHLHDSFVGLYDAKASIVTGISAVQRRVLERLTTAKTNGITQSQLCEEFGIKENNMFYVLRNLECRELIVRQSSIVREKELLPTKLEDVAHWWFIDLVLGGESLLNSMNKSKERFLGFRSSRNSLVWWVDKMRGHKLIP